MPDDDPAKLIEDLRRSGAWWLAISLNIVAEPVVSRNLCSITAGDLKLAADMIERLIRERDELVDIGGKLLWACNLVDLYFRDLSPEGAPGMLEAIRPIRDEAMKKTSLLLAAADVDKEQPDV